MAEARGRVHRVVKVVAVAALVVATAVPAAPAHAAVTITIKGVVECTDNSPVSGVWIESSNGGGKFAEWKALPGRARAATYVATVSARGSSTNIQLRVGCGKLKSNPKKWTTSNNATTVKSVKSNRIVNVQCNPAKGTCSLPPKGPVARSNFGDAGYCTWGAYKKWYDATGYYPAIGGNAIEMDNKASKAKFRVTSTPQPRSMVVFNDGTKYGHVGWVTDLTRDKKGRLVVHFVDMNGGDRWTNRAQAKTNDFDEFHTRKRVWTNQMAFIVAPA